MIRIAIRPWGMQIYSESQTIALAHSLFLNE